MYTANPQSLDEQKGEGGKKKVYQHGEACPKLLSLHRTSRPIFPCYIPDITGDRTFGSFFLSFFQNYISSGAKIFRLRLPNLRPLRGRYVEKQHQRGGECGQQGRCGTLRTAAEGFRLCLEQTALSAAVGPRRQGSLWPTLRGVSPALWYVFVFFFTI